MNKLLTFIIILVIVSGCKPYRVDKNSIRGKGLKDGFAIDHLIVNTLDDNGKPISYHTDTSVTLEVIDRNERLNKIYFYKPSEEYYWLFFKPISAKHHDILPIIFKPNNWYLFWRLNYRGSPDYSIFIYVDDDGKFNKYFEYKPGPY